MTRQSIDGGGWFDLVAADKFMEDTRFDGHNYISVHTGSQWSHETLYRTTRGTYILHASSQWQGAHDTWSRLAIADAVSWLIANGDDATTPAELHTLADLEA